MIKYKTNLLSAKKSVNALALCLATCSSLMDPCCADGTKRTFDEIDTGDTNERPLRRARYSGHEMQEEGNSYEPLYKNIFTIGIRELEEAESKANQTLRNETLGRLKSIANYYSEASYIYARFIEQDPASLEETLHTAIQYFEKIKENDELFVKACYHKGLCHKRLGQTDRAIASFETIAERYSPAQAQYGSLLYDKSMTTGDVSIKSLTKHRAIEELMKVKDREVEATYKLGIIYSVDNESMNLLEAQNHLILAENMFQTDDRKAKCGIYSIHPLEAQENAIKKADAAYRVAAIKWKILHEEGQKDFAQYLQGKKEEIKNIKYYLKKSMKDYSNNERVENLNATIDEYFSSWDRWWYELNL